jgi:endonuclease YncB( thermonuclease family)
VNRFACITAGLLGLAVGLLGNVNVPQPGVTLPARVIDVHDGDTLTVEFVPQRARIRLIDCWAPELNAPDQETRKKAQASRDNLARLADNRDVMVHIPWNIDIGNMTSLGRVLAKVYLKDGTDVSAAQVKAGYATATK